MQLSKVPVFISLLVTVKISTNTTSPLENDMFPDGMLGSRLFAFNSCWWWHSHMFSLETSACSRGPGDNSSKQSWHRKTEAAVMYRSTPGCRARARVFSLPSISVSSLGAHKLLDSSASDFGLQKNFSGHLNSFRGFQPGSASEVPGNFQKKNTDLWAPSGPTESVFLKNFPSDSNDQSQVWEPIIIPHSHFSDEVSNLPKLKGQFIQQIFILQLLCSRHSDLIAQNSGLEVPVKHLFLVSQSLA